MKNFMNKYYIKNVFSFLILMILVFIMTSPFLVGAQGSTTVPPPTNGNTIPSSNNTPINITINNPFNCGNSGSNNSCTITDLLRIVIDRILIPVGGVVAVIMIMYSGFLFVIARGNSTKIDEAKRAITWAVIGAMILLGAWVLSTAIQNTVNSLRTT